MNVERFCDRSEPLIPSPQLRRRSDKNRGDEMRIRRTDTVAVKGSRFDHLPHLFQSRHCRTRQVIQKRKSLCALPQRAKCQFPDKKRMDDNAATVEQLAHFLVARTEIVDPDGSVCENHCSPTLRRGTSSSSGIVPPSAASLRALSRSIKALRASLTRAVFSATPVNSWASLTKSSSSASVVLIYFPQAHILSSFDVDLRCVGAFEWTGSLANEIAAFLLVKRLRVHPKPSPTRKAYKNNILHRIRFFLTFGAAVPLNSLP